MKKNLLFGALFLMAGSLLAADSSPKDDVTAAAKKLADTSYSWKLTQDFGANSPFQPGPTEGKVDKDGVIEVTSSFGDNTSVGYVKGKKVAAKTDDGWKSSEDYPEAGGGGGGGGFDMGRFAVMRLQNLKAPSAELQDLVSKTTELKKDGDVISGDLTKEGAESLLTFGFGRGRGGPNRPAPKDAKGTLKIWLKDGAVVKYETKASGKTTNRDGDEMQTERTNTTEIKNVGATKIDLPDEAKKKLG